MSKAFQSWLPLLAAVLTLLMLAQAPLCLAGWGSTNSCCTSSQVDEDGHPAAAPKGGCCQLHAVAVAPFAPVLLLGAERVSLLATKEESLVEGLVFEIDYPPQLLS